MPHKLIPAVVSLLLLLQGLANAWAAPMLPSAARPDSAATAQMPCHGAQPADEAGADCCGEQCNCAQLCGASIALPGTPSLLGELLTLHFEAVRSLPGPLPAHLLSLLRPPIATPG